MKNLFSRSELVEILCGQISQRGIDDAIKKRNDAGLFSLSGRILANGKPEKLYKFSDLPKKWQKKIADANAIKQIAESNSAAMDEASGLGNEKSLAVMPDQSSKNSEITNRPFKIAKQNNQSQEQKNSDPAATAAVSGAVSAAPAASLVTSGIFH